MSDIFNDMPPLGVPQYKPNTVISSGQNPSTSIAAALPAAKTSVKADTVEISQPKVKKQGPVKKLKSFIANVKKFFATTGEYIKGTVKGLVTGGVAAAVVYTAGDIVNLVKGKAAQKAGQETFKKIPNKALACVVLLGAMAVNLWNSSLDATERRSEIEHRWTGHKN